MVIPSEFEHEQVKISDKQSHQSAVTKIGVRSSTLKSSPPAYSRVDRVSNNDYQEKFWGGETSSVRTITKVR